MAVSAAKKAANRKNATKSTGPKTLAGKKASASNATRHAVLSVIPVLPGVERAEDWTAHRNGTLASLAPIGYLETTLADRVASLLWRLGRVTRYEAENTASELDTAEADLADALRFDSALSSSYGLGLGKAVTGTTPTQLREELEMRTDTVKAFLSLREYEADDPFPPERAQAVFDNVKRHADVDLRDLSFPFVPEEADDRGWDQWLGWTKRLVLEAVAVIAAASKKASIRDGGAEELWRASGALAEADVYEAARALREAEGKLQRIVRSRLLLSSDGLEKVVRYEAHIERSLYKALHELQRLQATRTGTGGAPIAFDVDMSVGPRVSEPETYDTTGEALP